MAIARKIRVNSVLGASLASDGYHLQVPDHPVVHAALADGIACWKGNGWVAGIVARSDADLVGKEVRKLLRSVDRVLTARFGEDYPKNIGRICAARMDQYRADRTATLRQLEQLIASARQEVVAAREELDGLHSEIREARHDRDQIAAGQDPDKPARMFLQGAEDHAAPGDILIRGGHPIRVTHVGAARHDPKRGTDVVPVFFDWSHDALPLLREEPENSVEPH